VLISLKPSDFIYFYPTLQSTIVWEQKTPVMGVFCGSSKREEKPFSLFSPQFCSGYARLNPWCTRKPLLLFTAQGGLITQPYFQSKNQKTPTLTTPIEL
jgi:hypothetical protein